MADFADSFDLYAAFADAYAGYWDSGAGTPTFVAGRFSGSQALHVTATSTTLTKSSGANDAVHHLVVACRQTAAITGSTLGLYLQLLDGTTGQCAVVFRSDGAILLTSGSPGGTVLDTYTGAFPVANTWYAFEIEIVINNVTGRFRVRKNGNTADDYDSTAIRNTRVSANNYANKLTFGMQAAVNAQEVDDLYWRSGSVSGTFLGDLRCYTRMPASDASVQFSRSSSGFQQSIDGGMGGGSSNFTANLINYIPFTATYTGTVGSVTFTCSTTSTGSNFKCALYNNAGSSGSPGTVLGTATPFTGAGVGPVIVSFPTPIAVVAGSTYYIGFGVDTASGQFRSTSTTLSGYFTNSGYAAFPVNNPSVTTSTGTFMFYTVNYSPSANYMMVAEAQQDATTSYVYDSTPGDADFYGIAAIASTPVSTFAVVTRGYMQKSDAGTRTAAVQIKSGGTTVASPTLVLTTSGFLWAWRMDLTDPATSAAWTAAAVNNVTIGPTTVA
jgi:hypothetical protein